MTFYPKIHFLEKGAYKPTPYLVVSLENRYRLGTSKVFQVKKASLIKILMQKRNFYQGERVSLKVLNPYFNFEKDFLNGTSHGGVIFGGYEYATISAFANNTKGVVNGFDPGNFFVQSYEPRYYKFTVNRFADPNYKYVFPNRTALTISNTTFRVLNNTGILVSDQSRYEVGEILKLTFSTSANIPLCGQFPGLLENYYFRKYIDFSDYNYTFYSNGECVGPTSITVETLIDWTPLSAGDTRVQIRLGSTNTIFATRWFTIRNVTI